MSEKPVIFISHATTDNPIVDILKAQIEQIFANGVAVFASSVPGVIKPGRAWLEEIKNNLEVARAVIVVVTPVSINRPWIWFEVGASWSKMEMGNKRIYPVCVPEIDFNDLPAPLNSLQALSLGKAKDVKSLFQELCDEFEFGNLKGFKASTITSRLPKYSELKINQNDLNAGTIYSGPYEDYSDEELHQIIDEWLCSEQAIYEQNKLFWELDGSNRQNIFMGRLMHYREIDEKLKLPQGTTKRLLKKAAEQYKLYIDQEWEHSARFTHSPKLKRRIRNS